jgi:hypothetical protein
MLRVSEVSRFNETIVLVGQEGSVVLGLKAASKLRAVPPPA